MTQHTLQYPVCPQCCYDLSDSPLSDSSTYTCSECGDEIHHAHAIAAPPYIGHLAQSYFMITIPPIALCTIGLLLTVLNPAPGVSNSGDRFFSMIAIPITLWILLTPLAHTIKVAMWDGPNEWDSPTSTYLKLALVSSATIIPIFALCSLSAYAAVGSGL